MSLKGSCGWNKNKTRWSKQINRIKSFIGLELKRVRGETKATMAGMNSWGGGRRRFGGGELKWCRLVGRWGGGPQGWNRRKWDISNENEGEEDVDLSELFNCVLREQHGLLICFWPSDYVAL